jgi:hypothetical protein
VEGPDIALPPPEFAIVGAPRCGTTAMYRYLASHPGVAMSSQKEARFFSTDIDTGKRASSWAEYEALWDRAPPGALRGEATPDYIQSKVAIRALLAARPDAKLIAMVRNPVEIVASHHAQLHVDGIEDAADLETAWRLQERRKRGEALPRGCTRSPAVFQYVPVPRLRGGRRPARTLLRAGAGQPADCHCLRRFSVEPARRVPARARAAAAGRRRPHRVPAA